MAEDIPTSEAYGRFKARFKPGHTIHVFYRNGPVAIKDISDAGFKLENPGQTFREGERYVFDLVFHDVNDVCGWRVNAQCRWTTEAEAGFLFMIGNLGKAISNRIASQHLSGRLKLLNGGEL